jgi:hypothetical protein
MCYDIVLSIIRIGVSKFLIRDLALGVREIPWAALGGNFERVRPCV